ncbi:MAG: hypothetical protein ACFE9C_08655 [Candidatus Hodarchaeota archaeon]
MAEDQPESIEQLEEKEEKRKIRVVEQIDNRLAIQGQAYMKGQLKDALSFAYEIIELAKPEGLNSFIREQEDLIARIKRLLEEREEKKLEKLRAEQERQRFEKMEKLKSELNNLEYSFRAGFDAGDFKKTEITLEKAKTLLSQFDNDEFKTKWHDLENKHLNAKLKKELIEKAQKVIEESIELKQKFHFDSLKLKLVDIIKELKENNIEEHLDELEYIQDDILKTEKAYLRIIENIEKSIKELKILREKKDYKSAISQCEKLLKLAESIDKNDLIKEYSEILISLQKNQKFEELKETIKNLNDEALELLKKGNILPSLKKFEMIKGSITYYLHEV